jgi:hypothetical protein
VGKVESAEWLGLSAFPEAWFISKGSQHWVYPTLGSQNLHPKPLSIFQVYSSRAIFFWGGVGVPLIGGSKTRAALWGPLELGSPKAPYLCY